MSSLNASSGQLSSSAYAERRKELLKLVNQLRAIGYAHRRLDNGCCLMTFLRLIGLSQTWTCLG